VIPRGAGRTHRRRPHIMLLRPLLICLLVLVSAGASLGAQGENGAVAAEHVLASRVGVDVLAKGGNAVDAAVAASFATCVVNPSSCGIGGGGFMVIFLAADKRAIALDYRETAPAAATRDMFVRDGNAVSELSRRGGLAVGVPGEVRGLTTALAKFGTLSLAEALAPAIHLAKAGFPAGSHLADVVAANQAEIAAQPLLARNLLRGDGSPKREGDEVTFPELGRTLEAIAAAGPAAFYAGAVAQKIVDSVRAAGGSITLEDLASYEPRLLEPASIDFAGYRLITMPPPSSAGVALEVVGMIAEDDLAKLGRDSVEYTHLLAEALKHGFADRARHYGDPLDTPSPLAELLAPANLRSLRARIKPTEVLAHDAYGSDRGSRVSQPDDHGTSHISVMDRHGNAVACTTTINTAFGSMVVAGDTGIILNNEMDDFSAQPGVPNVYGLIGAEANAIAPGKRPLSSMSPTIAIRDGAAVLAVGASGGPLIITSTLQTLLNALVFGLDTEQAVAAPRIHHQWTPAVLAVEAGIDKQLQRALRQRGHTVKEVRTMAAVQLVQRTAQGFFGASDPRKGGQAAAW